MLAYLFVLIAVAVRVLAGTGTFATLGFTPVGASLLFFGSRMPRKHLWAPVALLIASDLYLNYEIYGMSLTWDQTVVWAWYAGACGIGMLLRGRVKPLYVAGAAVGSAVSFFLISNFAVWLSGNLGYAKDFGGLFTCFAAAVPFFEKGLTSDLLFSAVFFSIPVMVAQVKAVVERNRAAA